MNKKIMTIFGIALAIMFVAVLAVFTSMLTNTVEESKTATYKHLDRSELNKTYFQNGEVVSGAKLLAYISSSNQDGELVDGDTIGNYTDMENRINPNESYKIIKSQSSNGSITYRFMKQ